MATDIETFLNCPHAEDVKNCHWSAPDSMRWARVLQNGTTIKTADAFDFYLPKPKFVNKEVYPTVTSERFESVSHRKIAFTYYSACFNLFASVCFFNSTIKSNEKTPISCEHFYLFEDASYKDLEAVAPIPPNANIISIRLSSSKTPWNCSIDYAYIGRIYDIKVLKASEITKLSEFATNMTDYENPIERKCISKQNDMSYRNGTMTGLFVHPKSQWYRIDHANYTGFGRVVNRPDNSSRIGVQLTKSRSKAVLMSQPILGFQEDVINGYIHFVYYASKNVKVQLSLIDSQSMEVIFRTNTSTHFVNSEYFYDVWYMLPNVINKTFEIKFDISLVDGRTGFLLLNKIELRGRVGFWDLKCPSMVERHSTNLNNADQMLPCLKNVEECYWISHHRLRQIPDQFAFFFPNITGRSEMEPLLISPEFQSQPNKYLTFNYSSDGHHYVIKVCFMRFDNQIPGKINAISCPDINLNEGSDILHGHKILSIPSDANRIFFTIFTYNQDVFGSDRIIRIFNINVQ